MPQQTSTSKSRASILVIDDEPAIVTAFTRLLGRRHQVEGLTDAREALGRIRDGARFDVILCDLSMPEMGGLEFYDKLSNIDGSSASRVVFLSGGGYPEKTQRFLEGLPNHTVSKPFDSQELLGLISSMTR
jgi:CheY-like chemotaxis protein